MKDHNQIAFGILQAATLTESRPGEAPADRQKRANGIRAGAASLAKVTPEDRRANGLKGAIKRWGTIRERDNSPMPKKDLNQLAYSILRQATGEEPRPEESAKAKAGRAGGMKGGVARAATLTPEQRAEIAKKAAAARWKK